MSAEKLSATLAKHERLAIAVSGGVDSLTLAHAAHRLSPSVAVTVFHALSPAVDEKSTKRVVAHAEANGWTLTLVRALEFSDPNYLKNPVNRCFFCKSNLYDRIANVSPDTIASGTNVDDLGDYRPGLAAAADRQVVHPFVEAGMRKTDVRHLARSFQLEDIADLPAQPCLASRIETGISIKADDLAFVSRTEDALLEMTGSGTLRCRITNNGVRIEFDAKWSDDSTLVSKLKSEAQRLCAKAGYRLSSVEQYQRGSAFLHG